MAEATLPQNMASPVDVIDWGSLLATAITPNWRLSLDLDVGASAEPIKGNVMQDNVRPIAPISIAGLVAQAPNTGIQIMKTTNAYTGTGSRQTIAIKQLEALIERRKSMKAREILEVLANAERGPLTAPQIKATELLLTDPQYADLITPDDLTNAIVDLLFTAEDEAKVFAASHKQPFWRALAIVWFRKCKKRKPALARAA